MDVAEWWPVANAPGGVAVGNAPPPSFLLQAADDAPGDGLPLPRSLLDSALAAYAASAALEAVDGKLVGPAEGDAEATGLVDSAVGVVVAAAVEPLVVVVATQADDDLDEECPFCEHHIQFSYDNASSREHASCLAGQILCHSFCKRTASDRCGC